MHSLNRKQYYYKSSSSSTSSSSSSCRAAAAATTILWPLYRTTSVSWHLSLELEYFVAASEQTKQTGCESACYCPYPPSPFIINTQPKSRYSWLGQVLQNRISGNNQSSIRVRHGPCSQASLSGDLTAKLTTTLAFR